MESMGVGGIYGCVCKEVDFLILLIPTPGSIHTFCSSFFKYFLFLYVISTSDFLCSKM